MILGVILAVMARWALFPFESTDYRVHFGPWYDYIANHGFFQAFGDRFHNYPPLYVHMIGVCVIIPGVKIIKMKALLVLFDLIGAAAGYFMIRKRYPKGLAAAAGFWAILFAPTVIMNGALWTECDMVFTAPLLISLYGIMTGRKWLFTVMFALASAVKPQTIFMAPVLAALWMRGTIRWKHILVMAAIFLATFIPSWIAGRSLTSLVNIFTAQPAKYLNWGAANPYAWLPGDRKYFAMLNQAGMVFAASVMFILTFIYSRLPLERPKILISAAFLASVLLPYVFPQMHERYFYIADVLGIIYAFYVPRHFWMPVVMILTSMLTYMPFLFKMTVFPIPILAIAPGVIIVVLLREMLNGNGE